VTTETMATVSGGAAGATRPTRRSDLPPTDEGAPATAWVGRPVLAGLLRTGLALVPLVAAVTFSAVVDAMVGPQQTWGGRIAFWLVLVAAGSTVALLVERLARAFLPIPFLLRLTLVFPDQAPSRYKVARAAANPARLRKIAEDGAGDASTAASQVLSLITRLAHHDKHTRGHSERVRVFSDLIAEQMGITGLDRDKLRWGALLHDVGKMTVPASILNKTGRPSAAEWAVLQGHPTAGREQAGPLYGWLGPWAGGITEHHERWDATGYPLRLGGEAITLAGRIVAVADSYETMTAARSYKKPMATRYARQELVDCSGTQFDPQVVRAFLAVSLPRLLWRVGPLSFLLHLPFLVRLQSGGLQLAASTSSLAGPATVAGLGAAAAVTVGAATPVAVAGEALSRPVAVAQNDTHLTVPHATSPTAQPGSRPLASSAQDASAHRRTVTTPTHRAPMGAGVSAPATRALTRHRAVAPTSPPVPVTAHRAATGPLLPAPGGEGSPAAARAAAPSPAPTARGDDKTKEKRLPATSRAVPPPAAPTAPSAAPPAPAQVEPAVSSPASPTPDPASAPPRSDGGKKHGAKDDGKVDGKVGSH